MSPIEVGIPVTDVRGRRVGVVAAVNSCCIGLNDGGLVVKRDAVFTVGANAVELICDANQVTRYGCAAHGLASEFSEVDP